MSTSFSIRVELHDADWSEYEELHKKLAQIGVITTVTSADGEIYKLPPAEYITAKFANSGECLTAVYDIAASVRKKPAVFITESAGRRWKGLEKA